MSWKRSMAVVLFAAGLAACGSGKNRGLTVSAQGPASAPGGAASRSSLDAGHGIVIQKIQLVVRKVELEASEATCMPTPPMTPTPMGMSTTSPLATGGATADDHGGSDDGSGDDPDDDSCEIEQGPFLVVLSGSDLAAGTHPIFDVSVPAGTYEEIALRIGTISAENAAQAPVEAQRAPLAELAGRGVSLEVTGTIDAATFTFAAPLEARQKREGAITIDPAAGADLTFVLDASAWFTAADGSKLDPNDPAAEEAILANVRASLRLVHDEDHDGEDDEHDDHG